MKTAFFVAFNRSYILPVHVLINSILEYCPNQDIILSYETLDKERECNDYIDYLKTTPYVNRLVFIPEAYQAIQNERFYTLLYTMIPNKYESICHIDGDMFLTHNFDVYFDMSCQTDILIGVRDFSDRFYHDKNYINKDGTNDFLMSKYFGEFVCTVPMWLNKHHFPYIEDIVTAMVEHRPNDFGDMENVNMKMANILCDDNKLLALPCEQFVQTRFSFMNPISRIVLKNFSIEDCNKNSDLKSRVRVTTPGCHCIKSVHGKFYNSVWVRFLQDEFDRHLVNSYYFTDGDFRCDGCAANNLKMQAFQSLELGCGLFKYFLNKHIEFPDRFFYKKDEQKFVMSRRNIR